MPIKVKIEQQTNVRKSHYGCLHHTPSPSLCINYLYLPNNMKSLNCIANSVREIYQLLLNFDNPVSHPFLPRTTTAFANNLIINLQHISNTMYLQGLP